MTGWAGAWLGVWVGVGPTWLGPGPALVDEVLVFADADRSVIERRLELRRRLEEDDEEAILALLAAELL